MLIRSMQSRDVLAVTRLHQKTLGGLLTRLGSAAIRAYYSGALLSGAAIALVAEHGDELAGFVFGSMHPGELKRIALRRNPVGVVTGLALGIVRRPSNLLALRDSRRGPDRGRYDASAPELTYIAVGQPWRGGGVAVALLEAFTGAMREAGAPRYELSVEQRNQGARTFYERHGFQPVGEYHEFGLEFSRYALTTAVSGPGEFAEREST